MYDTITNKTVPASISVMESIYIIFKHYIFSFWNCHHITFCEVNLVDLFVATVFNLMRVLRIFKRSSEFLNRGLAKSSCCLLQIL